MGRRCRLGVGRRESGGKPDPQTSPDWAAQDRIAAGQGGCGRDRIRTCVGNAGDSTGRTAGSPRVLVYPRLVLIIAVTCTDDLRTATKCYSASLPVPPQPTRPSVERREVGGKSRLPSPPGLAHAQPDSLGFLWLDPAAIPANFAQDLLLEEARVLAAVQKPIAARSFTDPAGPPTWRTLRSWFLVSTRDRMINPDLLRFMAAHIGATTVEVRSSHASPVSSHQVARLILVAAHVGG
jgi:hypothetical protein